MKAHLGAIAIGLALFAAPAAAFDDDSRDDTRSPEEVRTRCENGRTVTDSQEIKTSCAGDTVYTNRHNTGLFKNEARLNRQPIRDFKVARDGRVYYLSELGPYLYDENGPLNSHRAPVVVYLVASSGDVVYLNSAGEIFKNGAALESGAGRVPLAFERDRSGRHGPPRNPLVSANGRAIYRDDSGFLYVDGERLAEQVKRIRHLLVNTAGDVYFTDDAGRLYRNRERLFDGRFSLIDVQLSPTGEVAYLTDQTANNLFLGNRALGAGSRRVVSFSFTSDGDILYRDSLGRLWQDGRQITR